MADNVLANVDCPAHNPIQHRDMQRPWCDRCGRAADGERIGTPRGGSRFSDGQALTWADVEEIVGADYMADRLVDAFAVDCATCGALIKAERTSRLRHAEWHAKKGS